jgi:hypothetical protein
MKSPAMPGFLMADHLLKGLPELYFRFSFQLA